MKRVTTTPELSASTTEINSHLFDDWFDPIESGIRDRVRGLIEEMIRGELDAALSRPRYGRRAGHPEDSGVGTAVVSGHRHGSRVRTLTGTFGKTEIAVPRARLRANLLGPIFVLPRPTRGPSTCSTENLLRSKHNFLGSSST